MGKIYRYILALALAIAALLTAGIFASESITDPAPPGYPLLQTVGELVVMALLFTSVFFLVMSGVYILLKQITKFIQTAFS